MSKRSAEQPRDELPYVDLPSCLSSAIAGAYLAAGLAVTTAPRREPESADYGACRLGLNGRAVVFRVAKTTPTKIGQFVTAWKRPLPGADIAPLDSADAIDFLVVSVAGQDHHGQFVFDRAALLRHGVMSREGLGGKRAIRVYPPWSAPVASSALKAQQWQLPYFVALDAPVALVSDQLRALFGAGP